MFGTKILSHFWLQFVFSAIAKPPECNFVIVTKGEGTRFLPVGATDLWLAEGLHSFALRHCFSDQCVKNEKNFLPLLLTVA